MAEINLDDDYFTNSILSMLSSVPEERQIPLLRSYLEDQVNQLEQLEIQFYDCLCDSAFLASQRMQDVRLDLIEVRLSDLENPKLNFRDIIFDVVMEVTFSLVIVFSPHISVAALSSLGLSRILPKLVRTKPSLNIKSKNLKNIVTDIDDELEDINVRLAEQLSLIWASIQKHNTLVNDKFVRGRRKRGGYKTTIKRKKAEQDVTNSISNRDALVKEYKEIIKKQAEAKNKLSIITNEINVNSKKISDSNPKISKKLEKMKSVEDAIFSASLEKIANIKQQYEQSLDGSVDDNTVLKVSPTDILSDFITSFREEKRKACLEYSEIRNTIRYTDEDSFIENTNIRNLILYSQNIIIELEAANIIRPVVQSDLIMGIEFTLWAYWLQKSGALNIKDTNYSIKNNLFLDIQSSSEVMFDGSILIKEFTDKSKGEIKGFHPSEYSIKGSKYIGINLVSDALAGYLFSHFTKKYLTLKNINLPFLYDPIKDGDELSGSFSLDDNKYFIFENNDKKILIKKIKVLNIHAFLDFFETISEKNTKQEFNMDIVVKVGNIFDVNIDLADMNDLNQENNDEKLAFYNQMKNDFLNSSDMKKTQVFERLYGDMKDILGRAEARMNDRSLLFHQEIDETQIQIIEDDIELLIKQYNLKESELQELKDQFEESDTILSEDFASRVEKLKNYKSRPSTPGKYEFRILE